MLLPGMVQEWLRVYPTLWETCMDVGFPLKMQVPSSMFVQFSHTDPYPINKPHTSALKTYCSQVPQKHHWGPQLLPQAPAWRHGSEKKNQEKTRPFLGDLSLICSVLGATRKSNIQGSDFQDTKTTPKLLHVTSIGRSYTISSSANFT